MSENCNQTVVARKTAQKEKNRKLISPRHELSNIKRVIGIISGKGGVGKSMVTSMFAVTMNRMGYHTAILDADVTGPSIPKAFGIRKSSKQRTWLVSSRLRPVLISCLSICF